MWATLSRPNLDKDHRFHVHVERFDIQDFADKSDAEIAQWLEDRWVVKSRRLASLQKELDVAKEWTNSAAQGESRKRL